MTALSTGTETLELSLLAQRERHLVNTLEISIQPIRLADVGTIGVL